MVVRPSSLSLFRRPSHPSKERGELGQLYAFKQRQRACQASRQCRSTNRLFFLDACCCCTVSSVLVPTLLATDNHWMGLHCTPLHCTSLEASPSYNHGRIFTYYHIRDDSLGSAQPTCQHTLSLTNLTGHDPSNSVHHASQRAMLNTEATNQWPQVSHFAVALHQTHIQNYAYPDVQKTPPYQCGVHSSGWSS